MQNMISRFLLGLDNSFFSLCMLRVRVGKQPPDRAPCPERVGALEKTIKGYADKLGPSVVEPEIGLTFDSLGEAYDFYNIYSWEFGFGIRYGKSRLNAEKTKCMQEVVCGCSVSDSSFRLMLSIEVVVKKIHIRMHFSSIYMSS